MLEQKYDTQNSRDLLVAEVVSACYNLNVNKKYQQSSSLTQRFSVSFTKGVIFLTIRFHVQSLL